MNCPSCQSSDIKKNGHIHNGKQNYQCTSCGRQFVADNQKKTIGTEQKEMIKKLLLERISLLRNRLLIFALYISKPHSK